MRSSTAVVRGTVNASVVGSIPTSAAIRTTNPGSGSDGNIQFISGQQQCWQHRRSY